MTLPQPELRLAANADMGLLDTGVGAAPQLAIREPDGVTHPVPTVSWRRPTAQLQQVRRPT